MTVSPAFQPLLREQARLIERGVRCVALAEGLVNDCPSEDVHDLLAAAPNTRAFAFSLEPNLAGYASHAWAINLFAWGRTAPDVQRHRIWGLLLGYAPDAIQQFEHQAMAEGTDTMATSGRARSCPQKCGGASEDKYHAQTDEPGMWQCTMFNLPHMHRTCRVCGYEWAEQPRV